MAFLCDPDVIPPGGGIVAAHGGHFGIPDGVKPLITKLLQGHARNFLEALEKLESIGIAVTVPGKIEGLAGFESLFSQDQAQHADDFRRLDVSDSVDEFIGIVEAFPHDAAHMAPVFQSQRAQKGVADGIHLLEPNERGIEAARHVAPFHVHRVGFVEPHIEGRFHGGFAAALVVFEFMNNDRVGVQEGLVEGVFVDEGRVGDDGSVADVFHAAEIGFVHGDGAVGIPRVFVILGGSHPKDRILEDFHGNAHSVHGTGGHQVFQLHFFARRINRFVFQDIPGSHAGDEKIRSHGHVVFVSDDLPARFPRLEHGAPLGVGRARNVAVADEVRVGPVRLEGGGHGAFGPAVVQDGHDALESPLLALGHVLPGSARGRRILVDALEDMIRWEAPGAGLDGKPFPLDHPAGQAHTKLVARRVVNVSEGSASAPFLPVISPRIPENPFHTKDFQVRSIERQFLHRCQCRHLQAVGPFHAVFLEIQVKGQVMQPDRQITKIFPPVLERTSFTARYHGSLSPFRSTRQNARGFPKKIPSRLNCRIRGFPGKRYENNNSTDRNFRWTCRNNRCFLLFVGFHE